MIHYDCFSNPSYSNFIPPQAQFEAEQIQEEELFEDISSLHMSQQDIKDSSDLSAQETPRKTAARLLDCLMCSCPPGSVSLQALPLIAQLVNAPSADLWDTEKALLALGTLAGNPDGALAEHLPSIHLSVLALLSSGTESAEVKETACWCLARHAGWIFESCEGSFAHASIAYDELVGVYLSPLVETLHLAMQQPNTRLQSSATSALVELYYAGGPEMARYVPGSCAAVRTCQGVYGHRGYALLCDLLESLSHACSDDAMFAKEVGPSVDHIMTRVPQLDSSNCMLYPLFEVLISIVPRLGSSFQSHVGPLTCAAYCIASSTLNTLMDSSGTAVAYHGFAVKAVDVLCAVLESLSGYGALAAFQQCHMPQLGGTPMQALLSVGVQAATLPRGSGSKEGSGEEHMAVVSAGLGLVADVLRCYGEEGEARSRVTEVVQVAMASVHGNRLTPTTMGLYNNAMWLLYHCFVLSEALGVHRDAAADAALQLIVPLTHDPRCDASLRCNFAALLGALASAAPSRLSTALAEVVIPWCSFCCDYDRDGGPGKTWDDVAGERRAAVTGLVRALALQPALVVAADVYRPLVLALVAVVDLVDMEKSTAPGTAPGLLPLVRVVRSSTAQWDDVVRSLSSEMQAVALSL